MTTPTTIQNAVGVPIYKLNSDGSAAFSGDVTLGVIDRPEIPQPNTVTLYTDDGTSVKLIDNTGTITSVVSSTPTFNSLTVSNTANIEGDLNVLGITTLDTTIASSVRVSSNLTVGSASALGDNGSGELQLANVTSAPTTNPTGGVALYATSTGAPVKVRDSSGNVRDLCKQYAVQTATQASVGTGQTASTALTLPVEANAKYLVECWVYWTTINSATVTTSWTGPAGTTFVWNDTTTGGDVVTTLTGVSPAWLTGNKMIRLFGTLTTTGTAGTLTFTFASSVAASVTTQPQSTLTLERIS